MKGIVEKLKASTSQSTSEGLILLDYSIAFANGSVVDLKDSLGKKVRLTHSGGIFCSRCYRTLKKPSPSNYCYPCMMGSPEADLCQVRPELCHFAAGTCRDSKWGVENCHISHSVYLAEVSGIKVGITRTRRVMERWAEQGAMQAVEIMRVKNRKSVGDLEVQLKNHFADKSNWRKMLARTAIECDLSAAKDSIKTEFEILDLPVQQFKHPRLEGSFLTKAIPLLNTSFEGQLLGIKGQYLIFAEGVINMRKYAGFELEIVFLDD